MGEWDNGNVAKKAADLVKEGYLFVCASCVVMQKAHDKGATSCHVESCGSPMMGKDFPEYEGPLTLRMLERACFFTGREANMVVRVKGGSRPLGIHESHVHLVEASPHAQDVYLEYANQIIKRRMDRRVPNLADILSPKDTP
jgi:hypothetical protein